MNNTHWLMQLLLSVIIIQIWIFWVPDLTIQLKVCQSHYKNDQDGKKAMQNLTSNSKPCSLLYTVFQKMTTYNIS